jgi:hypothetical protein
MSRRIALFVFLVLLLTSPLVEAKKRKQKKRKRTKSPKVAISSTDRCNGCQTFVEDYHRAIHELMFERRTADKLKHSQITGPDLDVAAYLYEKNYSPQIRQAWADMKFNHWRELVFAMQGTIGTNAHTMSDTDLLQHRRKVCWDIRACPTMSLIQKPYSKKDPCAACQAIGTDLEFVLMREKPSQQGKARLTTVLELVCPDIGKRHDSPSYLEEMCEDLMEEHGEAFTKEMSSIGLGLLQESMSSAAWTKIACSTHCYSTKARVARALDDQNTTMARFVG